jgi:hypothetical protein
MSRINWMFHPNIEGRLVAEVDGTHLAWIQELNWGGHVDYVVKSYVNKLNDVRFATVEAAREWVEHQVGTVNPDKSEHKATAEYVRISDLDRVKHIVKIKKLAELAGLNPASIAQKLGRGTELTVTESEALTKIMVDTGVIIERRA